jgi:hypothetical protein
VRPDGTFSVDGIARGPPNVQLLFTKPADALGSASMPRIRYDHVIARAPAHVFSFLADFANDAKWRANVLEMKPLGKPDDLGGVWSRQIEVRKVPGKVIETEAVITACEPPRVLSVKRASGPIRPEAIYRLEPVEDGKATRVSFELAIELDGAAWLALPFVWLFANLAIRPVVPKDFTRLAALLA